jgi:predicted dithiol-disulfide oxidoreductase (DUF899 family)
MQHQVVSREDWLAARSAFYKDPGGAVFDTYSAYARGLDLLVGAYNISALRPRGATRRRCRGPWRGSRHHDRYGDQGRTDVA